MIEASMPTVDESLEERILRLRAYLAEHPSTRLMDLEPHTDPTRGPLYLLAKHLKTRGELIEHPRTRALAFPGQGPMADTGQDDRKAQAPVLALRDLPPIATAEGVVHAVTAGEEVLMPATIAAVLINKGAAERVETAPKALAPEPEEPIPSETALECRSAHPAVAEAASLYEFQKIHREQGAEAAVAFKRLAEAPRVEAQLLKREQEQHSDEELLRSGKWWDVVNGAIDEFLAGEPMLRKVIVYSALSSGLRDRLHLMVIGDSQVGKSYALRSIGSKLFPEVFIDLASMSGKGPYYAAKDANDPRYFDGKILLVDELADQSEATRDFMKAGMSPGQKTLRNMTVDEHKKSSIQELEGLPIFWSTSAEVLEDAEGQLMNRPFVVNPDESKEQTRRVLDFQREAVTTGLLKVSDSKIPRASRLLARILEERGVEVYNLFAHHVLIGEEDARARNTLPMFFSLVAAVAYANRFARPLIKLPDGRKLLFASYQDNLEAAELWGWASGPKSTGLPIRLIELLKVLPIHTGLGSGQGMEIDEIVELYNKRTGRKAGHKTLLNYLSTLSSKNKATYFKDEQGRHLWCLLGASQSFPTLSHLLIGMESEEGNRLLDEALEALSAALPQLPTETKLGTEELRERVLDQGSMGQRRNH